MNSDFEELLTKCIEVFGLNRSVANYYLSFSLKKIIVSRSRFESPVNKNFFYFQNFEEMNNYLVGEKVNNEKLNKNIIFKIYEFLFSKEIFNFYEYNKNISFLFVIRQLLKLNIPLIKKFLIYDSGNVKFNHEKWENCDDKMKSLLRAVPKGLVAISQKSCINEKYIDKKRKSLYLSSLHFTCPEILYYFESYNLIIIQHGGFLDTAKINDSFDYEYLISDLYLKPGKNIEKLKKVNVIDSFSKDNLNLLNKKISSNSRIDNTLLISCNYPMYKFENRSIPSEKDVPIYLKKTYSLLRKVSLLNNVYWKKYRDYGWKEELHEPQNIKIEKSKFCEALDRYDAYILNYHGTTFYECLNTGKPTFLVLENNFFPIKDVYREYYKPLMNEIIFNDIKSFLYVYKSYLNGKKVWTDNKLLVNNFLKNINVIKYDAKLLDSLLN